MPKTQKTQDVVDKMSNEKLVYQIKEVQKITGLSRNTVGNLIASGQLKAIKAGPRRWIIPAWALHNFLKQPKPEC